MPETKKALIIVNACKEYACQLAGEVRAFLENLDIPCDLLYPPPENETDLSGTAYSFAVTLGGDGTVLYAARCCALRSS